MYLAIGFLDHFIIYISPALRPPHSNMVLGRLGLLPAIIVSHANPHMDRVGASIVYGVRLTLKAPGPPSSLSSPPSYSLGYDGLSGYTLPITQQTETKVAMNAPI